MHWLALSVLASLFAGSSPASAEIITSCGASKGYGYYLSSPINKKPGWQEDGVSGGEIILSRNGDQYDVLVTDALGTKHAQTDGLKVISVPQTDPAFTLVVSVHPETGVVQHYLFQLDGDGTGQVVWGSIKGSGGLMPKSAVYVANCKR